MFQELQDQMQCQAGLLLAGRFEDMSQGYMFPMPVYLEGRMICLRNPAEGIAQAAALREALRRRQIETLTITLRALEVPQDDRFRVWADWHAASPVKGRSGRLGLICYMRETPVGFQSEMLHYFIPRPQGARASCVPQRLRA